MSADASTSEADVQSLSWEGRGWSSWNTLEEATAPREAKAPDIAGVYRLRCAGQLGLIYVGETGRSLRERLRQLKQAMKCAEQGTPDKGNHYAGGCVWDHSRRGAVEIEVSWVELPEADKGERKGIECDLIAAYRRAVHENRTCQFGGHQA